MHKNMPDLRLKVSKLDIQKMADSDPANPDVGNSDDQRISVNLPGSNLDKFIRRCLIAFKQLMFE